MTIRKIIEFYSVIPEQFCTHLILPIPPFPQKRQACRNAAERTDMFKVNMIEGIQLKVGFFSRVKSKTVIEISPLNLSADRGFSFLDCTHAVRSCKHILLFQLLHYIQ